MADSTQKDIANRLDALERSLRVPQKVALAATARESAGLRQNALQLDSRPEVTTLASRIAALADRGNVIIEWTARDVDPAVSAAASCCCCCCCCHEGSAIAAEGGIIQ